MSLEGNRAAFVENKAHRFRLNIPHTKIYADTRNIAFLQRTFVKMPAKFEAVTAVAMKI
jgi:hypothetical protein